MIYETNFYNLIGPKYDIFDLIFLLGHKCHPRQRLAVTLSPHAIRLLDICVGTAATSIAVAKQNPQTQIIGIDLSEGMLAVAQKKIRNANLNNLTVQIMGARRTTFEDSYFDGVMTSYALHEMESGLREEIFKEVRRVLRTGGMFYLLDFAMQTDRWTQWFLAVWGRGEPSVFREYLKIDWQKTLLKYDLRVQDIQECSFSNLVIAQKI